MRFIHLRLQILIIFINMSVISVLLSVWCHRMSLRFYNLNACSVKEFALGCVSIPAGRSLRVLVEKFITVRQQYCRESRHECHLFIVPVGTRRQAIYVAAVRYYIDVSDASESNCYLWISCSALPVFVDVWSINNYKNVNNNKEMQPRLIPIYV